MPHLEPQTPHGGGWGGACPEVQTSGNFLVINFGDDFSGQISLGSLGPAGIIVAWLVEGQPCKVGAGGWANQAARPTYQPGFLPNRPPS